MATQSVQRSTLALRDMGYEYSIVEKFNSFVKRRQDFGGFADILAWKEGVNGVLAVQACAGHGDAGKHVTKLTTVSPAEDEAKGKARIRKIRAWLSGGNKLEIWSWAKRGARGERKLWTVVRTEVVRDAVPMAIVPHAVNLNVELVTNGHI